MRADPTATAERLWGEGRAWADILGELRRAGATKIGCIRAAVQVLRVEIADAKMLVHYSDVWADVRPADEEYHESLTAATESVARRRRHGDPPKDVVVASRPA